MLYIKNNRLAIRHKCFHSYDCSHILLPPTSHLAPTSNLFFFFLFCQLFVRSKFDNMVAKSQRHIPIPRVNCHHSRITLLLHKTPLSLMRDCIWLTITPNFGLEKRRRSTRRICWNDIRVFVFLSIILLFLIPLCSPDKLPSANVRLETSGWQPLITSRVSDFLLFSDIAWRS